MLKNDGGTRRLLVAAGILGGTGVGLGAFGAHALDDFLVLQDRLETWETAVHYQLVHALALLALAVAGDRGEIIGLAARRWIGRAWCLGAAIFSLSLYLLCLSGWTWLGAITPLGGLLLLGGWGLLIASAYLRRA